VILALALLSGCSTVGNYLDFAYGQKKPLPVMHWSDESGGCVECDMALIKGMR